MQEILIGGALIVAACLVAFGYSWIRKNKKIVEPIINDADKVLDVINILINYLHLDDVLKDKTKFYLDLADKAVQEVTSVFADDVDLRTKSLEVIYKTLKELDITPTGNQHKLIDMAITEALIWYENNK